MRRVLIVMALTSLVSACGVDGDPQRPAAPQTAAPVAATDATSPVAGAEATGPATAGDWLPLPGRFAETLPPEIVWGL